MASVIASLLRRSREDRRGSGDVAAMVVVVPLGLAAVLLFVFFGRQGVAAEEVTHAAAVAARAASLERSAGEAQAAAQAVAAATLAEAGTSCAGGPDVAVAASRWAPGGVVNVTVTCQITGIADIGAPSRTVSSSARATIDFHRGYSR
jgi:Flp pilus assembly protein TadG